MPSFFLLSKREFEAFARFCFKLVMPVSLMFSSRKFYLGLRLTIGFVTWFISHSFATEDCSYGVSCSWIKLSVSSFGVIINSDGFGSVKQCTSFLSWFQSKSLSISFLKSSSISSKPWAEWNLGGINYLLAIGEFNLWFARPESAFHSESIKRSDKSLYCWIGFGCFSGILADNFFLSSSFIDGDKD